MYNTEAIMARPPNNSKAFVRLLKSVCTQYAGVLRLPRGAGSLPGVLPLLDLQLLQGSLHSVHLRRMQGQLKPLLQRVLLPLLLPGLGQLLRLQDLLQLLQPLLLLFRGTFRVWRL